MATSSTGRRVRLAIHWMVAVSRSRTTSVLLLATRLTRIGTFVAEEGLFSQDEGGKREVLAPRGYEHRLDA